VDAAAAQEGENGMNEGIKLLIVDDEVDFLDTIAERLESRGFLVTKAVDGEEALAAARGEKFDLALVDLRMPGIDGSQLLGILKSEHRFLEVIILTGHSSVEAAVECTKLGAFDFLVKPYDLEKLLEVLQRAYEARLRRKFEHDQQRLQKLTEIATGASALSILEALREMDDGER
jgi:DNA-binding NtrC family response regulator